MSDVIHILTDRFRSAITLAVGGEPSGVDPQIRPAGNPKFGDYQANFAMRLAKDLGEKPRDVAEKIVAQLDTEGVCEKIEIAGPGFINLYLSSGFVDQQLAEMAADADRLGVAAADPPQTVVVDYSGPNVAKEMHVGHLRSTAIGDAIARVLDYQGHHVIRQNHLGDWGTQFGRVMLGLWYDAVAIADNASDRLDEWIKEVTDVPKKGKSETPERTERRSAAEKSLLDEIMPWHQTQLDADPDGEKVFKPYLNNHFPDLKRLQLLYTFATAITDLELAKDYYIDHPQHKGKTLAELPSLFAVFVQTHGIVEENAQEGTAWEKSRDTTVSVCQEIYERLNVLLRPKDVKGESFYNSKLPGVIEGLEKAGLLQESRGARVVFPEGFKDRDGDSQAMIVQKSDGGYLYATTDLAAVRYRIDKLKADRVIYVTDARQSQHFAMVFAVARQAQWVESRVQLEHVPFGTVLGKDNKPFKTREGGTVKLVDLLDEAEKRAAEVVQAKGSDLTEAQRREVAHTVGIGALKYADLSSDRIKDYVFDWDRMLSFEGNTAPYLQNAYVRIRSIFRKGGIDPDEAVEQTLSIGHPAERALAVKLLGWPGAIEAVANSLEPHRLCTYLYELAAAFHQFYEKCPVLGADHQAVRSSRLGLCNLVGRVLEKGLGLLGIGVVERM